MKKMMTNMKTLVALLMAGAAVTSCSSDNEMDSLKAPAGKTYTMTVQATKDGDAMTRALADGGTTLTSTWSKDDVVEVWSVDGTTTKYGELTAATAGISTTLSGTLTTKPSNNETLTLKYLSPNYSTQDGTLTGFATSIDKVCDYATATVTATVDGDNVTTDAATFQHQQAVVKFTLKNSDASATLGATKLFVTADGNTYTVTPASAASVLYVAVPAISAKQVTLTAKVGDTYYDFGKTSATFENGKFYRVTVKMTEVPSAIPGLFSISSGEKVVFSKGNLKYNGTTWSFFDNQYDYYTTHDGTNWDKFGWSTSATTYGMNTSTDDSTYSGDFADWGNNSDLQTALGTGWFTLSSDEWTYLFDTRTTATTNMPTGTNSGAARYTKATVAEVPGVILFPDNYAHPAGVTVTVSNAAYNTGTNDYTTFTVDASNWVTMQSAGCVFLPAAGYRSGSSPVAPGQGGCYWSATPGGTDVAYFVNFYPGYLYLANHYSRNYGFSVRLVRQVQP